MRKSIKEYQKIETFSCSVVVLRTFEVFYIYLESIVKFIKY